MKLRWLLLGAAAACGAAREPPRPAASAPVAAASASASASAPAPRPEPPFDPVAEVVDAASARAHCDRHVAAAKRALSRLRDAARAKPEELDGDRVLGPLDEVVFEVLQAKSYPALLTVAHPSGDVREATKDCEPTAEAVWNAVWLDEDVAKAVRGLDARVRAGKVALAGERAKLLSDSLAELKRRGVDLPADKRERLRELSDELVRGAQEFEANISASRETLTVDGKAAAGLPADWIARHPKDAAGKITVGVDYDEFYPFATHSPDRKAARELYKLFVNRGGDRNLRALDRLLRLRAERAKILGFDSWVALATEPLMAKTPAAVRDFLTKAKAGIEPAAKLELQAMMAEHVKLGGKSSDVLSPADRYFYEDRVRQRKYAFDAQKLSAYLDLADVERGLLEVVSELFSISIEPSPARGWHPDARAFDVWSKAPRERLGRFWLDLRSRPDKYKHHAMFPIKTRKRLASGAVQLPEAALVCNFAPSLDVVGKGPSLMTHDDVVTFFHELGHVLHHVLTRSDLASFSGINVARDFVEAPSQLLEEWAVSKDVLRRFARHHETRAEVPAALLDAMAKSRGFGRALYTQRQIFLAFLDHEYHSRPLPFDTTKVLEEVQNKVDAFKYVPGTHFQTSFGHLVGYEGVYYGYQWSLAIARDALGRFRAAGMMDAGVARAWVDDVLAKGGGEEPAALVERFLGRPLRYEPYFAFVRGE